MPPGKPVNSYTLSVPIVVMYRVLGENAHSMHRSSVLFLHLLCESKIISKLKVFCFLVAVFFFFKGKV